MSNSQNRIVRRISGAAAGSILAVTSVLQIPAILAQEIGSPPPVVAVHSCPLGVAPGVARCHSLVLVAPSNGTVTT